MISSGTAVSLVVLLGIITVLLVRSRNVRAWEAICIALDRKSTRLNSSHVD